MINYAAQHNHLAIGIDPYWLPSNMNASASCRGGPKFQFDGSYVKIVKCSHQERHVCDSTLHFDRIVTILKMS